MSGAAACAAWLVLGHVLLWRITRRARRPKPWLLDLFRGACKAVGVRQARVLVVYAPLRPVSCGLIRPTVLLGTDDCLPSNRPRLRQVLLHEAAHLRQRDAWGNALFNLAMPLLYFHPLYWVLRSGASLAREMVADDIAAASTSRAAYAADLLELARTRSGYRPAPIAAIGIFRSPSHFYRRMHMLMQRNIRLENRCSAAWKLASGVACAGVLFAASATLGVRRAEAQESPKPTEIKEDKLDRTVLDAKLALDQAIGRRDGMLKLAKDGKLPGEVLPDFTRPRSAMNELDARVALAQKNLDEVQAAQQSVRSAAGDDDNDAESDRRERDAKKRAEMDRAQADAQRQLAIRESVRQQLEAKLRESDAQLAQLRAQLAQAEAQLKVATAQAQQEMKRAQEMLKQQWDKGNQQWNAAADQVRNKIDQIILDKLKRDGLDSARGSDIEELVRRTYLDVAGRLPTPDERNATAELLQKYLKQFPDRAKDPTRERPESNKAGSAQLSAAVSGLRPQLDLVALANSYADAMGNITGAQEELNGARSDPRERATAKAKLVAAEQKARLLRSITQAALEQAKQELIMERKRVEAGMALPNEAIEAEGRVRILSLILQSSG
ncbi:MAG TPA: M56 family metallopeptidase, partial [Steroidobacteraceae bacterium]